LAVFQRDSSGGWKAESELETGPKHFRVTIQQGEFGTGELRAIPIGGHQISVQGTDIVRLPDEVIDGKRFIRLRSKFGSASASRLAGPVVQDLWIDAESFLVRRTEYTANLAHKAILRTIRKTLRVVIEYSGFNESVLPGPLPDG
jgi:hypothetical protein